MITNATTEALNINPRPESEPEDLHDLPRYLRQVLPDPESISQVEVRDGIKAVLFRWHGLLFLVDLTLRVLEVRQQKLYLSHLSTLLQTILRRRRRKELLLAGAIETLNQAERLIWAQSHSRQGIGLVDAVKETLEKEIKNACISPHPPQFSF